MINKKTKDVPVQEKRNTILVNDNIDIVSYSSAVQDIVSKFYDEDGNYTPHFGRANAIGIFFSYFVDIDSLNSYFSDIDVDLDIDFLLSNEDCLKIYNDALSSKKGYRLDFANAYFDANKIVSQKNKSFESVINSIQKGILSIVKDILPNISEDNIERLTDIAKSVSEGNFNSKSIVDAYVNSKDFMA